MIVQVLVIVALVLAGAYLSLIIYYARAWNQIIEFNGAATKGSTRISILIPARNEAENIARCLQSVVNQNYPTHLFEVIVIDDFSEDRTAEIVRNFTNVKLISLRDHIDAPINSYKKKAIETGIQSANGELIVTTDADCIVSAQWLTTIASFYEKEKPTLMVMPVSIQSGSRAIEIFQDLDFMALQGITGASVNKKVHSMCNGANLAYTKKAFEDVNGFAGVEHIASGDDMLLMYKIADRFPGSVRFVKSSNLIVNTSPVHSVSEFFQQRIRWASKADKYDDKRITAVLFLVYFFNLILLALFIISLFGCYHFKLVQSEISLIWIAAGILLLKTLAELVFLIPVAAFFNKTRKLIYFPLFQPAHIIYTVVAGFLGKFGQYKWKGRRVR